MKRFIKPIYIFPFALTLLSACADSGNEPLLPEIPETGNKETVIYTFQLNLDGETAATRDGNEDEDEDEIYYYDPENNEFGKGHHIATLIYGVFDKNGVPTIVNPEAANPYQVKIEDYFKKPKNERPEVRIELVKGLDYTLVFWAQSDKGKEYFNTEALNNIEFNRPGTFLNNQDDRDAFCFRYKITQFETEREKTFTLTRPFAQINIGFEEDRWNELMQEKVGSDIASSVCIEKISSNFDLFNNKAILNPDSESQKSTATLNKATIPFYLLLKDETNQYLQINRRNEPGKIDKYIWVSLSYALPPDYTEGASGETAFIDIENFILYSGDKVVFEDDIHSLPVMRNHRTCIIYKKEATRSGNTSPLIWVD